MIPDLSGVGSVRATLAVPCDARERSPRRGCTDGFGRSPWGARTVHDHQRRTRGGEEGHRRAMRAHTARPPIIVPLITAAIGVTKGANPGTVDRTASRNPPGHAHSSTTCTTEAPTIAHRIYPTVAHLPRWPSFVVICARVHEVSHLPGGATELPMPLPSLPLGLCPPGGHDCEVP